jgi:hydroxymethylbilane synthase
MPIGAHAAIAGDAVTMTVIVTSLDGRQAVRATTTGLAAEPEAAGTAAATELLARGAGEILADVQRAQARVDGLQP